MKAISALTAVMNQSKITRMKFLNLHKHWNFYVFLSQILFLCVVNINAKSKKKNKDESAILTKKLIGKTKPNTPPAIIAIEIVDPNENKTSKNSKRTIEQALGYGYNQPSAPRYEVYKYQKNIPPYRGNYNLFSGGIKSHNFDIQKSQSYQLNQHYQPGTTLYSTVNSQGEVGGLTSNVPHQNTYHNEPQIPVIILRVFPNQLADPSAVLHPNLPQSHPLASAINSIDIQSLLAKYFQRLIIPTQIPQQYNYQPNNYQYYQQPQLSYQPQNYPAPQQQPQTYGLTSYENYPRETHTRVIFRDDKNEPNVDNLKENEVKTIKIHLPENHSFSSVQVQTPGMQYGYTSHNNDEQNFPSNENNEQKYYYQQSEQSEDANYDYDQPQNEESYNYQQPQQETNYNYQNPSYYQTYQTHSDTSDQNYNYQSSIDNLNIKNLNIQQEANEQEQQQREELLQQEQEQQQQQQRLQQQQQQLQQQQQQLKQQQQQQHHLHQKQHEEETEKPYNYHAHQKRSKNHRYSTEKNQNKNTKLNPARS